MKKSDLMSFLFFVLICAECFAQQAGDLDYAFGSLGISIVDNNGYDDIVGSSAVQQWNGKIVIAGTSVDGAIRRMSILRMGVLGNPDVTFSDDGWQTLNMSGYYETGTKALIQITRPVLAGYSEDGYFPRDFVMYRFRGGDGELSENFGDSGIVVTDFFGNGSLDGAYTGVVVGNKIILAGEIYESDVSSIFALARYNLGGNLDFSFGNSGLVTTDFSTGTPDTRDIVWGLAVEMGGKIIAVGQSSYNWAMARYNPDGSLDNSFGANGLVVHSFGNRLDDIALLPDGKFLVAGRAGQLTQVARYNNNGTIDNTFGTSGQTQIQGVSPSIILYGNKIIVATSLYSSNFDFVLTRLNYDGQIDSSFGNNGLVVTEVTIQDDVARDIHIQPSGRIVVTGSSGYPGDFVAVGYHNDPFQPNVPFYIVDDLWNQGFINFSNLGDPAVTSVEALVFSDSTLVGPFNDSFVAAGVASRFYEINVTPQNAGTTSSYNASLRLYYSDADIEGINESNLKLVRLTNDGWIYVGGTVNTSENYVEANNIHNDGIFTFADPDSITNVDADVEGLLNDFSLSQNFPNPFNPSTVIGYQLPVSSNVTIKVYDPLGREVTTLVNEEKSAGSYEVSFNASHLSSGLYFYRLQVGSFVETKKMILLR
ncbi:MAG: T9SS type A sorting domain-containing protein [bacterium]|nr:T9SS type A sorting domain-containing protein [bacterium]